MSVPEKKTKLKKIYFGSSIKFSERYSFNDRIGLFLTKKYSTENIRIKKLSPSMNHIHENL